MSTKYTVRVASPVAYEYWEATTDTYDELIDATAELKDLKAQAGGNVTPQQAEQNVKSAFGKTTEQPSSGGGGFGQKSSGFGNSGNQGKQQSVGDKVELGEHEGYLITIQSGKFGWYANAYNRATKERLKNQNLPKGADPASFTLTDAIALWSE